MKASLLALLGLAVLKPLVVRAQTLLAAQKDPEKYRNLIVRIAGYSAYFTDLSPMQQAEIIARTEEAMGA